MRNHQSHAQNQIVLSIFSWVCNRSYFKGRSSDRALVNIWKIILRFRLCWACSYKYVVEYTLLDALLIVLLWIFKISRSESDCVEYTLLSMLMSTLFICSSEHALVSIWKIMEKKLACKFLLSEYGWVRFWACSITSSWDCVKKPYSQPYSQIKSMLFVC